MSIEERHAHLWISGTGQEAKFEKASKGFFLHLKGSYEALYVGTEPPTDIHEGDLVVVTIDKVDPNNAKP